MHPHSGVTAWLNVSQLLSGKWPKSLLSGVTQHKQTPLVQFRGVSMQWIKSSAAEADGNVHVCSKLREGDTKWLLKAPQIRSQFGRNRKVIIKRQLSGSVIFIPAQVTACFCEILGQKQMLVIGFFFFIFAVVINKSKTHCRAPDGEHR